MPLMSAWRKLFLILSLMGLHRLGICSAFTTSRTPVQKGQQSATELRLFNNLILPNRQRDALSVNGDGQNGKVNDARDKIPFVLEQLGDRPREQVFKDIAEMCISVFFNNGKTGRALPPWKEAQLSYLRLIQTADLKRRRIRDQRTNAMFVAYRVDEASSTDYQSRPLILNMKEVYNLNANIMSHVKDYVRGEVLGFCEVSTVPFGLAPSTFNSALDDDDNFFDYDQQNDNMNSKRMLPKRMRYSETERPVLTNLSVKLEARRSGVGSKLLDACERAARSWGKTEIVLEVEEENVAARKWYQKRGYRVLFSDPTSKRYDVNGLVLKKVRCTRQILRKSLAFRHPQSQLSRQDDTTRNTFDNFGLGVLRRLRDNVLQSVS